MLAVCEKSSTLKKIVDALKDLCKETNVNITTEEGMIVKAMDSSHVSLFHLQLKDIFTEFSVDMPVAIAFSLDHLSKILKVCDNDATLKMSLKGDKSKLYIESISTDRSTQFAMHLLDLEMENMEVPEMHFPISIIMQSSEYTKICRDMNQFSDTMKMTVKTDSIELSVDGDCGEGKLIIQPSEKIQITFGACIECMVSLKYLLLFSKATPISENVKIEMGEDIPIKISFEIQGGDSLIFYLAPKVDE